MHRIDIVIIKSKVTVLMVITLKSHTWLRSELTNDEVELEN
jgi:hypothetical protein